LIQSAALRRSLASFLQQHGATLRCVALLWLPAIALVLLTQNFGGPVAGRDFSTFWLAGHAGRNPYGLLADLAHQRGWPSTVVYNFTYPPPVMFVTRLIAVLPLTLAFWVWNAIGALLFYAAARPHCPKGFAAVLAILTPAAILNFNFGQMGMLIGALWLFAWRGSNFSAAALAIKPHMGFLVLLKLGQDRRIPLVTLRGIALVLLPAIVFGPEVWVEFLHHVLQFQGSYVAHSSFSAWLFQSTTPFIGYGMFGWACFAVAGGLLLARRCNVWTAATATFLISPYGFHYDMTIVCLGFGVLAFELWDELAWYERILTALAFLVPGLVYFGTWFASPILLAGLWVQTRERSSGGARGHRRVAGEVESRALESAAGGTL
jgi:hypothetical protein